MTIFKINRIGQVHELTDQSYMLFAAKYYNNANCYNLEEFQQDIILPLHIKKIFTRYTLGKEINTRLLVNHLICFLNVFEFQAAIKLLFFRIEPKHHSKLCSLLTFLERRPDNIRLNSGNIRDIPDDLVFIKYLQENLDV